MELLNSKVIIAAPGFFHPGILKYTQIQNYVREEDHKRVYWPELSPKVRRQAVRDLGRVLVDLNKAGHTYYLTVDSLALVGGRFKLRRVCPVTSESAPLLIKRPSRKRSLFLGLVAALTVATAFSIIPTTFEKGWEIFRNKGVSAASNAFDQGKTVWDQLGKAWVNFQAGDYVGAQRIATKLAFSNEGRVSADARYILGNIASVQGLDPEPDFEASLAIYSSIRNQEGQLLCLLGLVRHQINNYSTVNMSALDKAEAYLDEASRFAHNNGAINSLRARIYFERGDLESAYRMADEAVQNYQKVPSQLVYALSGRGFFAILLGEVDKGNEDTMAAERMAVTLGNERAYHHNLVNRYLIEACEGRNTGLLQTFSDYYGRTRERDFWRIYYFTQNYSCESSRWDPSNPDPPPPPPPNGGGW